MHSLKLKHKKVSIDLSNSIDDDSEEDIKYWMTTIKTKMKQRHRPG